MSFAAGMARHVSPKRPRDKNQNGRQCDESVFFWRSTQMLSTHYKTIPSAWITALQMHGWKESRKLFIFLLLLLLFEREREREKKQHPWPTLRFFFSFFFSLFSRVSRVSRGPNFDKSKCRQWCGIWHPGLTSVAASWWLTIKKSSQSLIERID